jgi:hypothetical protein
MHILSTTPVDNPSVKFLDNKGLGEGGKFLIPPPPVLGTLFGLPILAGEYRLGEII